MRFGSAVACMILWWSVAMSMAADHSRIVASVGTQMISERDVAWRISAERCCGDSAVTAAQAFARIVTDVLESEVLRSTYGLIPPDSVLRAESARVDRRTKEPVILARIKNVYHEDPDAYLHQFIAPPLVNARLHRLFDADTTVNARERDSIRRLLIEVMQNRTMFDRVTHDTIEFGSPALCAHSERMLPIHHPLADSVASHLTPHAIWPVVAEDDASYRIIRLETSSDSLIRCTAITIRKRVFDPWFRAIARQGAPVIIIDTVLESDVRREYAGTWWLEGN